jgi:hypothetical protein
LNLAWLEIDLELEDEPRFLEVLERVLRKRRPPKFPKLGTDAH